MEKTEIVMDYEKAYKAVLQTATQWIKDGCTDKEKICLECVFPELRESKDEKIRKFLIKLVNDGLTSFPDNLTRSDVLSYLEKQKEPENVSATTMAPSCWAEEPSLQKEQKPAEWSEEDENKLYQIIETLLADKEVARQENPQHYDVLCKAYDELISWLKSLRPSWKPSEEQMEALCKASDLLVSDLNSLYNDLKKLM